MTKFFKVVFIILGGLSALIALTGIFASTPDGFDGMEIFLILFFAAVAGGLFYASHAMAKKDNSDEEIQELSAELNQLPIDFSKRFGIGTGASDMVSSESNAVELRQVTCASCGASIHVTAAGGECEYCGSPVIQA